MSDCYGWLHFVIIGAGLLAFYWMGRLDRGGRR